ncbi:MAG: Uma2 family endonuclease [Lewinellaceae bacterium]|nr:Uma2 family endonuclease [Phaeodactylibacter sp.]MCB9039938.1 Uma2 family endonuclease [Lewinellaceae bacterium]
MQEVKLSEYETERHKPMPSLNHSIIQANLIRELGLSYKDKYRIASELSLDLSDWPSVPDICIYPKMPLDLRQDVATMTEPPLCAIEIISPSQSLSELVGKAEKYFQYGVRSCWIVLLPLGNIYVFSSPDDYEIFRATDTLKDPALDIALPLAEVFES